MGHTVCHIRPFLTPMPCMHVIAVSLSRTRNGCTHGYAKVSLPTMAASLAAVAALDGSLQLQLPASTPNATAAGAANPTAETSASPSAPPCIPPPTLSQPELSAPLLVSLPTGRRDALFSRVPFEQRRQLRVDAVAAFSVTDQVTADRIAGGVKLL